MDSEDSTAFTPERAIRVLSELQSFERRLNRRTAGVLWMVWGLVLAALILSYETVIGHMIDVKAPKTLFNVVPSVLWLPWIVLGIFMTGSLRRAQALQASLRPAWSRIWRNAGAVVGTVILGQVVLGALFFGLGVSFEFSPFMASMAGAVVAALALFHRRDEAWFPAEAGAVGLLLFAAGFAISALSGPGFDSTITSLLACVAILVGFFSLGFYQTIRG